ncbi:diguanylate cyclase, partial [Klebsiella pneumoniae]|nr:diguanylate cyclase [Klebsiella pneumoniae]
NILHPHDLLGRFGGEEFAIFIPDTTREAAFELAERIRIQISQQPIYVYGKLPIFVQVSIGISYILQAITALLKVCLKKQTMHSIKQSAKGVIE